MQMVIENECAPFGLFILTGLAWFLENYYANNA